MPTGKIDFSIIICTYYGAERLPETLRHLAALCYDPTRVELVLVDNASSDDSIPKAEETWTSLKQPYRMQILQMPKPGKSNALAWGISHTEGTYLLICDDDNHLPPNYLQTGYAYFEMHPEAGILAGQSKAVADSPLPDWFLEYQWAYACGPQRFGEGNTTGRKKLWSAGMFIKRELAKTIFNGGVPMLLQGRTGQALVSGEDDEMCLRAWLMKEETHYTPALCFEHYMPSRRLTENYRNQLLAGFSHQSKAIGAYHRLYELVQNKTGTFFLFLRKLAAWLYYGITGNTGQQTHAADTLYFLVPWKIWETPENRIVRNFYLLGKKGKP